MSELSFGVEVEFRSDWHIGTGAGRHGSIDRVMMTDSIGLPYLPAKTVLGVLRDSAEIAANAFDEGKQGVWARWVRAIFGDQPATTPPLGAPRPAALFPAPLTLVDRDAIASFPDRPVDGGALRRSDLIAATKTLRVGVRIDPISGVAQEDMFRIEQRACAGLTLQAQWCVAYPSTDDQGTGLATVWPAELLLLAAAKITTRIGGKRRRGAGRADIRISGLTDLAVLISRVTDGDIPEPWPAPRPEPYTLARPDRLATARPIRRAYTLTVKVERPIVVEGGQRGNVVNTATFVPGAMLLGPLRQHLPNVADLIRAGEIVVTDATIEIDGRRGLPWPRALTVSKDSGPHAAQSLSVECVNVLEPHRENLRLKPKPDRYVDPACTWWCDVDVVQQLHASVDDVRQRPTEETGGLYAYNGIAPGTVLRAEVYLPDGVSLPPITQEIRLGRSSKDDYGLATMTIESSKPLEARTSIAAGSVFPVWLTSDVLLREDSGATDVTVSGFVTALARALDVPGQLALAPSTASQSSVDHPFADVSDNAATAISRRQGWQRGWGLPRPSLTGLAAGSVISVRTAVSVDADAIARTEALGVGDRTAEGFGRICLDPAALHRSTVDLREYKAEPVVATAHAVVRREVSASHRVAAWRRVVERTSLQAAVQSDRSKYLNPTLTRTQLSTLRSIVIRVGDVDAARMWRIAPKRHRVWGVERLDNLASLLETDLSSPRHLIWDQLFGQYPTDVPESSRSELAKLSVELFLTEIIRIATQETIDGTVAN